MVDAAAPAVESEVSRRLRFGSNGERRHFESGAFAEAAQARFDFGPAAGRQTLEVKEQLAVARERMVEGRSFLNEVAHGGMIPPLLSPRTTSLSRLVRKRRSASLRASAKA